MEYVLTLIMCAVVEGKTLCMPPHTMTNYYVDSYSCIKDGYVKSHDKIVEIGREEVNKNNIFIKFGCNENNSNKTSTSYIIIQ